MNISKRWKRFIEANAHYCPYCPVNDQEEVILVSDLEYELKLRQADKDLKKEGK